MNEYYNAINILTVMSFSGFGRAWVYENYKKDDDVEILLSKMNKKAREEITQGAFEDHRAQVIDDILLIKKKDYIKNPKENGYRSLHLIVAVPIFLSCEKHIMRVEIQLRTIAMDFWASLEHQIRYKKDTEFTDEMINELYECAKASAELDMRMDELRKKCDR